METQNVTFAVPKDILHELKLLATQRKMSLSRFVIGMMAEIVSSQKEYEEAKRRNLALLEKGFDLGTNGKITWTREELHARK